MANTATNNANNNNEKTFIIIRTNTHLYRFFTWIHTLWNTDTHSHWHREYNFVVVLSVFCFGFYSLHLFIPVHPSIHSFVRSFIHSLSLLADSRCWILLRFLRLLFCFWLFVVSLDFHCVTVILTYLTFNCRVHKDKYAPPHRCTHTLTQRNSLSHINVYGLSKFVCVVLFCFVFYCIFFFLGL